MACQVRKSAERHDAYRDAELIKQHYRRTPHAKKLFIALPNLLSTIFDDSYDAHERRGGCGTLSHRCLLRKKKHYPGDDNYDDPEIFSSVSSSDDDWNEVQKAKASKIWNQSHLDEQPESEIGRTDLSSSYQCRGTDNPLPRHQESGISHLPNFETRSKFSDSRKNKSSDPVCSTDGLPLCIPLNIISWFQPPWY